MNPFLKTPKQLIVACILWSGLGGLLGVLLAVFYRTNLVDTLVLNVLGTLILGIISTSAYFVSANFQLTQKRFFIAFLLAAGSSLFVGSVQVLVYKALDVGLQSSGIQGAVIPQTSGFLLPIFGIGVLVYAFSLVVYDAIISVHALKGVEQREAAKELWAKNAELKALRAQINPHFLFNSLNSISALTHLNPEKARAMVIELSQFYRESLTVSDLPLISLDRELAICKHFVAIETIRYGEKLKLDIDCNPDVLGYQIPPLCLQPLLENAIKHGVSQLIKASPVTLKIEVQHNKLYLLVANDIANEKSEQQKPEGTQTGLENLRSRLALLYGESAYCGWTRNATGFQVELIFPLSERV